MCNKKIASLFLFMLAMLIAVLGLMSGCQQHNDTSDPSLTEDNFLPTPTYDEIYATGEFSDTQATPSSQRVRVLPTHDTVYTFYTEWSRSYVEEDGGISTYSLCQDPVCNHTALPCIAYAARTSGNIIEAEGKLYLLLYTNGEKYIKLAEYDPSTGSYTTLEEYDNGGELLVRLGRYLYYYIIRVDNETEMGKLQTTRLLYRYDIKERECVKIAEMSPNRLFYYPSGINGAIYYMDASRNLCRCDANFQNVETLVRTANVMNYQVVSNKIYYLTKDSDQVFGTLACLNLEDLSTDTLYNDVTWFCIDEGTLYYTQYTPIEAFTWDFPTTDEEGNRIIELTPIMVSHGNMIYQISLDKSGEKGSKIPVCAGLADQDCYLGEVFAICNGYIYAQIKEPYEEGTKKGMLTGIGAVNLSSGIACLIDCETVLYS